MVTFDEEDYLAHYGTKRHSGRYEWGSGGNESGTLPRNATLLDYVADLKRQGVSEPDIAKGLGLSTGELRAKKTRAIAEQKQERVAMAQRLKDKGYSNSAIAERMKLPGESSVRALLAPGALEKAQGLTATSEMLKQHVAEKTYVDIGKGTESFVGVSGVSKERLKAAVAILEDEGYKVHTVPVPQVGTGFDTKTKVLTPPGTTWGEVVKNRDKIQQFTAFSEDSGHTFSKFHDPISIHPDRVAIRYAEQGGADSDGVLYIRPGVDDISIGNNRYAQVRVKVGKENFLKGMAVYKDDMPEGVDILFNTNKSDTGNKFDAMKKLAKDPDGKISKELPFESVVRQITADTGTPKERVTSAMNMVGTKEGSGAEGSWDNWSKTLSSQFLSKQSPKFAKDQLDVTFERREREFNEIMALTNPTVKKKLLDDFAKSTDSSAVHLKAANLPRQATRVILPMNSLKPTEVYAPGFKDGERVVLVRYPHGGTFEIPELTVNNKHKPAKSILGEARDAIGIHHEVAERLSGADFDGDTVLVLPNFHGKIKNSPALEQLKGFDPKKSYAPYDGMKTIDGGVYNAKTRSVDYGDKKPSSRTKGIEMGDVSNLITDMTIGGASHEQIARAVKHSMVVIDAEKHNLDWRRSKRDNGIAELKAEYQGGSRAGASTLISKKKQTERVADRKGRLAKDGGPVDRETGRRMFVETGKTRLDKHGNIVPKTVEVKKLDLLDDAHELSSGTLIERHYADHSNRLKGLANKARLASLDTPRLKYNESANKTYKREVSSLLSKLALAERNAPKERQAQVIAGAKIKAIRAAHPNLEPDTLKKLKYQAQEEARIRTGARKQQVEITQQEWDAIQAGAISDNRLTRILQNADMDVVRGFAQPRTPILMSSNMTARAQSMLAAGFTRSEVAEQLGVSVTTLDTATNE